LIQTPSCSDLLGVFVTGGALSGNMVEQTLVHKDDIKLEGFLVKESKVLQKRRKRWFVLTSQYLCAFRREGDYRQPTEFIRLRDVSCVKASDVGRAQENSLSVVTPDRTFFLEAGSANERALWMDAIMSCCLLELIFSGSHLDLSSFAIIEDAPEAAKTCKVEPVVQVDDECLWSTAASLLWREV